ncbi:MAG: ATP-binding cassette domain-containing protein [Pseudomonadota bacterium]
MSALELQDVELEIDGRALFAPISVRVAPGAVTSIVGDSGSGKSSLLNFLCGILPPAIRASGQVRLGEQDVTRQSPQSRRLGRLFQDPLLFPHLDVAGNVLFGLRARLSRQARRLRVADALASVGLDGMGDRDPATLSGGQQARVALLRVLLSEPRALLLDEPFSALDDDNRARVRELVFSEARKLGLPTLLVTHDAGDVAAAGGDVVELTAAARGGNDA